MSTLADIRAKLQAQETRNQQSQSQTIGDNAVFPLWNMPDNTTSVARFLPDGDTSNSFFWVERAMIRLPFMGVKNQPDRNKEVIVQVPCLEMYGENCPILSEVRTWYKDESLKSTANKYWKKRTYLFQGFLRSSSLSEENLPENPIRRFVISPQIFTVIKSSLMDPEIEEMPTDYQRGLDFRITKTKKGMDHADYTTSGWARKESPLSQYELDAIEAHGLFNLKEFLPKKPSDAERRVISELFEASINGRQYDVERWGAYYKPWGVSATSAPSESSSISVPVRSTTPSQKHVEDISDNDSPPWEEEQSMPSVVTSKPQPKNEEISKTETLTSSKAEDILNMIRARQNKTS